MPPRLPIPSDPSAEVSSPGLYRKVQPPIAVVGFVSLLTFLHYVGAMMRGPVLPLYATAHGATATGVGFIAAAHMMAAAVGSIPLGRAADVWGRRPLLLGEWPWAPCRRCSYPSSKASSRS